jgi:hypothetical protein
MMVDAYEFFFILKLILRKQMWFVGYNFVLLHSHKNDRIIAPSLTIIECIIRKLNNNINFNKINKNITFL